MLGVVHLLGKALEMTKLVEGFWLFLEFTILSLHFSLWARKEKIIGLPIILLAQDGPKSFSKDF